MDQPRLSREALLADLDIELVSALYQAASEADTFDVLVETLQNRYAPEAPASDENLRDAVSHQLGTIDALMENQQVSVSRDPLERAVEEVPTAAIVIDPSCHVIVANELGEALFAAKPGQTFATTCIDPSYRAQFDSFLTSARLRGNQRRIIVRLDPEQLSGAEEQPIKHELAEGLIIESPHRDHGCIALRALEIPWPDALGQQLQETFGLTEAECGIAREFYELRDSKAVAEQRGTTLPTVRTQLKSIYAKSGTGNQAQLLQLLSLLAARASLDSRSRKAPWSNPLGREASFVRSDGRSIAHAWQGAPDGKPVLVVHGHTLAHLFPPEADRLFRVAGLKLHILSRPGFGHSEFDPDCDATQDSAHVVREFCALHDLRNVPAIAISSGLIPLSKAIQDDPQLVSAIVNTGYIWLPHVPLPNDMRPHHRIVFKIAQLSPRLFQTFSRIAYRNMIRVGVDWYIDRLLGEDSVDAAYFGAGNNAGLIRAAARHLLAQGADVYAREMTQDRACLETLLNRDELPLLFAVPQSDEVHQVDAYRDELTKFNNRTFKVLPGTGELYFYRAAQSLAQMTIRHIGEHAPGYEACLDALAAHTD